MKNIQDKHVLVVGGGPAGIEVAKQVASMGPKVSLVEESPDLGGHVKKWSHLFPASRPAGEVLEHMRQGLPSQGMTLILNQRVNTIHPANGAYTAVLSGGDTLQADAVVLATGFSLFDAKRKEEYGYGIYERVYTSAELEEMFNGKRSFPEPSGEAMKFGLVHCVGSRDTKVNNRYCSRLCCVTAVKQAIELKNRFPEASISSFYMDMRMFGQGYEDMYNDAQVNHGIRFVRGRLSESFENPNGTVLLKVEDTLTGKPLRISVDMLVLMVGMESPPNTKDMIASLDLPTGTDRFLMPAHEITAANHTRMPGVFLAGTCTGPKSIPETLADARAASLQVLNYL